jgi:predicted Ser/Thr protein kinase
MEHMNPVPSQSGLGAHCQPGTRFGSYTILGPLGSGAMGTVLRARDLAGREVALKLLATTNDASAVARLEREAQVVATLKDPGIVGVHSAGEFEGRPYIVYELVQGQTLEDRLATLDRETGVRIVLDVARALAHAHEQGVVHRDLKPANILLDANDQPRIADFGVALAVDLERLTQSGALVGTPNSMAPEQVGGERERYGPHTDVWALGVLLYQVLTGTEPFQGPSLVELLSQISRGVFDRPRTVDRTITHALEAVCVQAMRVDPTQRYPDARAFAEALFAARTAKARSPLALGAALVLITGAGAALWFAATGTEEPRPQSATRATPADSKPAPVDAAELKRQQDRREAAHRIMDALSRGQTSRAAQELRTLAAKGPLQPATDFGDMCTAVLEHTTKLLESEPEASVALLEALAATGLQAQPSKLGTSLVGRASGQASLRRLSPSQFGRLLLGALRVDLPFTRHAFAPLNRHPEALPRSTRSNAPWVRLLTLRNRDRQGSGGSGRALLDLIRAEPLAAMIGPCVWAQTAARLVPRLKDEAQIDELLAKAMEKDPDSPIVHMSVSIVARRRAQLAQALRHGKRAEELFPLRFESLVHFVTLREILSNLLRCQLRLGRRPEARATWVRLRGVGTDTARSFLGEYPWLSETP